MLLLQEAIADYSAVLHLDPQNVLAYHNRGISFDQIGAFEKVRHVAQQERATLHTRHACLHTAYRPTCLSLIGLHSPSRPSPTSTPSLKWSLATASPISTVAPPMTPWASTIR